MPGESGIVEPGASEIFTVLVGLPAPDHCAAGEYCNTSRDGINSNAKPLTIIPAAMTNMTEVIASTSRDLPIPSPNITSID